jgi:hypothetical protein
MIEIPSHYSIKKYMYPFLESKLEVCFYYNNIDDSWYDGTYSNTHRMCTHKFGYQNIMGHIHPLRNTIHPIYPDEVNYYPSFEDIILPITQPINTKNYILTPIGLFISSYTNDNSIDNIEKYRDDINSLFYPLHVLTNNFTTSHSLVDISQQINKSIEIHIYSICDSVKKYIIDNIVNGRDYNLEYININRINSSNGGSSSGGSLLKHIYHKKYKKYKKKYKLKTLISL